MTLMEVKICGLTQLDDAMTALDYGADYLGFVLYPCSRRAISPERLRKITRRLPATALTVGVFVDSPPADILAIVRACGLSIVQLHGAETANDFRDFPVPVWRAVQFADGRPRPAPAGWPAVRYVADSCAEGGGRTGGTGRITDWRAAARLARTSPLMLAGGLTPENVKDAVLVVHPLGVDTAGGVEITGRPGCKDYSRMKRFIEAAHNPENP